MVLKLSFTMNQMDLGPKIEFSPIPSIGNRVHTGSQYRKSRPDRKWDFVLVFLLPGIPPGPLQGRRVTSKYLGVMVSANMILLNSAKSRKYN